MTTKLKVTEINEYGYRKVVCPFCDKEYALSRNPLGAIKRHIKNQARNEALDWVLRNQDKDELCVMGDHLTYFMAHAAKKKVVVTEEYHFDEDLKLDNYD